VQSDFSPHGDDVATIAAICRRLDSIPLAIDFAATRVATLGLQQVAAGLDDRLGMLTGGRRTALPRHRTLRATLDWSYELLPEPERLVMRRLAVFSQRLYGRGGELVAAGGEIVASEVVRSLANLVTKSLVTLEVGSEIAHHRLHETTRAYASKSSLKAPSSTRWHDAMPIITGTTVTEPKWSWRRCPRHVAGALWPSDWTGRAALDWPSRRRATPKSA